MARSPCRGHRVQRFCLVQAPCRFAGSPCRSAPRTALASYSRDLLGAVVSARDGALDECEGRNHAPRTGLDRSTRSPREARAAATGPRAPGAGPQYEAKGIANGRSHENPVDRASTARRMRATSVGYRRPCAVSWGRISGFAELGPVDQDNSLSSTCEQSVVFSGGGGARARAGLPPSPGTGRAPRLSGA